MKQNLSVAAVEAAYERLQTVVIATPLQLHERLSKQYEARVYVKREDLQRVRSYKLRGAFNAIASLAESKKAKGVVCASAGNHAQGVAFSCEKLSVKGTIYMPRNTPKQKVDRVRSFGKDWISVVLVGDTYDESFIKAKEFCEETQQMFVHPFDDFAVMAGQATVGVEILNDLKEVPLDYVFVPVGGGGLVAGLGSYLKTKSPSTKIVGAEPAGAPSMTRALQIGKPVTLDSVDTFVDGAAVKTVGMHTFAAAQKCVDQMLVVPEGKVCEEMIALYQTDGIIAEPAGTLSIAALDQCAEKIKGKTVICVISGGNNDISRYPEIMERSLVYKGLKHYFIIVFSQRPGALREYLDEVLGKKDDITLFEYIKKSNKETGPALVGIELSDKNDLRPLLKRMNEKGLKYEVVTKDSPIYRFLL